MTNSQSKKYLSIWLGSVAVYLLLVAVSVFDFEWQILLAVSNITMLPFVFTWNQEKVVQDPIAYIHFKDGKMLVGHESFDISKIEKVALDSVKGTGYFSLPYNQIKPGEITNFCFPADKLEALRAHLANGLNQQVSFIQ